MFEFRSVPIVFVNGHHPVITIMLFYHSTTALGSAGPSSGRNRNVLSAIVFVLIGILTTPYSSRADGVNLDAKDMRTNYFGDTHVKATFHLTSSDEFEGTLDWNLMHANRILARAEKSISVQNKKEFSFQIGLKLPHVKDDIAFPIDFNLTIYDQTKNRPALRYAEKLWIFPQDPFRNRQKQLKALNIYLFDPGRKMSMLFSNAGIPFKTLGSIDALARITGALIIIGEGTSLKQYRSLTAVMAVSASGGNTVLYLSPDSGIIPLPIDDDHSMKHVRGFHLQGSDIVHALGKHLDLSVWTRSRNTTAGVQGVMLKAQKSGICGEVLPDRGWPWMEIVFDGRGGRLVFCGFGLLDSWESSPAPRYLLAGIFQNCFDRLNASGINQPN